MQIVTMNSLRFLIVLGCAFFGASVGTAYQALRITGRPPEFRSQAKLIAGGHVVPNASAGAKKPQIDLDGMVIVPIESDVLKNRALARVRALNPDLKEVNVVIHAVQTKDSGSASILATSSDPKYSRIYLDALLDEFLIFQKQLLEEPQNTMAVEERASPATVYAEDWKLPVALGAGGGALLGGLIGLMMSLLLVRSPKTPQIPTAF